MRPSRPRCPGRAGASDPARSHSYLKTLSDTSRCGCTTSPRCAGTPRAHRTSRPGTEPRAPAGEGVNTLADTRAKPRGRGSGGRPPAFALASARRVHPRAAAAPVVRAPAGEGVNTLADTRARPRGRGSGGRPPAFALASARRVHPRAAADGTLPLVITGRAGATQGVALTRLHLLSHPFPHSPIPPLSRSPTQAPNATSASSS